MASNLDRHRRALELFDEDQAAIDAYENVIRTRLADRGLGPRYDQERLLSVELMDDRDYADLVGAWRDHRDEAIMFGIAAAVDLLQHSMLGRLTR